MINYYGRIDRVLDQVIAEIDKSNSSKSNDNLNESDNISTQSKDKDNKSSISVGYSDKKSPSHNYKKKSKDWRLSQINEENRKIVQGYIDKVFTDKELEDKVLVKRVLNAIDPSSLEVSKRNIKKILRNKKMETTDDYEEKSFSDPIKSLSTINLSRIF